MSGSISDKYCTLPGQTPVRLDSLDGHIIIIGEIPRPIPEQFIAQAKAAGCLTETELEQLKSRLLGNLSGPALMQYNEEEILNAIAGCTTIAELYKFQVEGRSQTVEDAINARGTELSQQADNQNKITGNLGFGDGNVERTEQIKQAVIAMINAGNAADFTGNGVPKVEALREKLGFDVTAAERDAAYEATKG